MDAPYGELLNHLRHGRIDLILGALRDPSPGSDLQQEEFFREPLAIVVRAEHPLLKSRARCRKACSSVDRAADAYSGPRALCRIPASARAAATEANHRVQLIHHHQDLLVRGDRVALLSAGRSITRRLPVSSPSRWRNSPARSVHVGVCTRADWSPTRMQAHFLATVGRSRTCPGRAGPRRGPDEEPSTALNTAMSIRRIDQSDRTVPGCIHGPKSKGEQLQIRVSAGGESRHSSRRGPRCKWICPLMC